MVQGTRRSIWRQIQISTPFVYTYSRMFPLRQVFGHAKRVVPSFRAMSSSGPLVDTAVDGDGIATVTMQRMPVNSINLELLQEMDKALDDVAKNCNLTSASPTVFSAGLDLMEMYKPDMKRLTTLRTTLQEVWIKLFGSNFITAAAINGHAPAGACFLSMSCEYRLMMSGKYTIGLNDTALGIVPPKWFMDTMLNTLPQRQAELALTTSKMFSVEEALEVGLIDEIGTDKADCVAKCKQFIQKFDRIPPLARSLTKQKIRGAPLKWMIDNREQDKQEFVMFIGQPEVQKSIEMYIQSMKNKKLLSKSKTLNNYT